MFPGDITRRVRLSQLYYFLFTTEKEGWSVKFLGPTAVGLVGW